MPDKTPSRVFMLFIGNNHCDLQPVVEYIDCHGEIECVPQPQLRARTLAKVIENCRRLARRYKVPFHHDHEVKET